MMENLHLLYSISVLVLLLSGLISGLELLTVPARYINFVYPVLKPEGKINQWRVLQASQAALCCCCFILLLSGNNSYFKVSFVLLAGVNLYSYQLRRVGKDGSDQVRLLGFLSYSLCFLVDSKVGEMVSIYFMGLQVILAYTTSGIMKVISPYWRKGDVLAGILGTYSYGIPGVSSFLTKNPRIEKFASHTAITMMLGVVVAFCLPWQWPIIIMLVIMLAFHFSISLLMGLNDFIITFPMAYPGIILLHAQIFKLPLF